MEAPRTLRTERLLLRPFEEGDFPSFARLSADEDVMRYIGFGGAVDHLAARKTFDWFCDHWERHGFGNWTVLDDEGSYVGRGGLNWTGGTEELPRAVEVAYVLDKPYWGRGLATEIARASIGWGFRWLDVDRIIGLTHTPNEPSQRVLRKAGLRWDREITIRGVPFVVFVADRPTV